MLLYLTYLISQVFYGIIIMADTTAVFVNAVFSDQDKILITKLYQLKEYKAIELTNEFSNKDKK